MIITSKYGDVIIYAQTVEQDAIGQIIEMSNSPLGENANIRIMPDCHAGAGCVIGTTMRITDKACPNLVGVDIGCGVDLIKTDIDFGSRAQELDDVIRKFVPFGMATQKYVKPYDFTALRCYKALDKKTVARAMVSLGTLGGGNHFIEAYDGGYLAVHSGSRNIGARIAEYYQELAEKRLVAVECDKRKAKLAEIPPTEREKWLKSNKIEINRELCYLTGSDLDDYLHDIEIMQAFAAANRNAMLTTIVNRMGGSIGEHISSVHNYIDTKNMILRKGAISAQKGEILVIPMNMRDGILICRGKGNPDWNFSAPHGAGRLYSRGKAKKLFSVDDYRHEMRGIYSSCICASTLDEAPFAYKSFEEIMTCVEPTVEILDRLIPVFNFKGY